MRLEETEITATVRISNNLNGLDNNMLSCFKSALQVVEILYQLGKTDDQFSTSEIYFLNKIFDILSEGASNLDDSGKSLLKQIQKLKTEHYDMGSVIYESSDFGVIELVFGKIISPDNNNRKMFGGVLGRHNKKVQNFISSFDKLSGEIYENAGFNGFDSKKSFTEIKSFFRCIDVIKLTGELNRKNKPVSAFYSGGRSKSIAALPNVVVFSNLYLQRFKIISSRLGNNLIKNYRIPDDDLLVNILVCWLRGHDLGHSFGADNLGKQIKRNRAEYYILHELKSDIVALFLIKNVSQDLFGRDIMQEVYNVFLSEMFRYIRKGNFDKFPDSGSAYYSFRYFLENSALSFDDSVRKYKIDYQKMDICIDRLSSLLFGIFENGEYEESLSLINRYRDIKTSGKDFLKMEFPDLLSADVPDNIDFNFNEP